MLNTVASSSAQSDYHYVIWKKADEAARDWAGGVSPKILYSAVNTGRLKAARIGAGRNMLFCERWINEWLTSSSDIKKKQGQTEAVAPTSLL